jgi:hypothetical protein
MTGASRLLLVVGCLSFLLALVPQIFGDEGMWLFTNPPKKYLKDKYAFDITDQWLTHVQRASVRFNSGGSGSFVSPNGLVLTNHHVGADYLQKVSTEGKDYYKNGFLAKKSEDEIKCTGAELNVLQSIEDVTDRVNNAVKGLPADTAAAKRREVLAEIEKESTEKTGLRSDVVTLYQGGQYHLYRFKKYTDVRLVFAPEAQIAFYGGDPDNFEYPRFDLDMCLFRIYEDGKPAKIEHYLKWSESGAVDGELVFVSGHPGRTNRLNTVAELEYLRDIGYPFLMQRLHRLEVMAKTFSDRSEENARRAKELLFSVQNSRKARLGGLQGLQDPELMARKKEEEKKLQETAASKEDLKDARGAWDKIAAIQKVRAENIRKFQMLEGGSGFSCDLFGIARTLVRAGDERPKPNGQRLREFRDSNLESLKHGLFSEEEIYDDWEIARLSDSLMFLCIEMGYNNPLVQKVLAGKAPTARAVELIKGCTLKDVKTRQALYDGGKAAVDKSQDPMLALVKLIDEDARAVRKTIETQVEEPSRQAYAEIAKVKFAREGTSVYPDATFTLRLAFGVVKGYEEAGKKVPAITTFAGLYQRSKENNDKPPFDLPTRWVEHKKDLNLNTPFNFVCTADIIGGNSGSPVVNKKGELVGLIFDGNIQSLVLDFAFTEEQARAVSVHSAGIIEAMRKVYNANELADELTGKRQ